jgi:hypothetical protein
LGSLLDLRFNGIKITPAPDSAGGELTRNERRFSASSKILAKPKLASTRLDQRACIEMIVHH